MDDSIPYQSVEAPAWKAASSWVSAILLALLFLASGVWKVTDPLGWAARVTQLQVPSILSMPVTLGVGVTEIFAAVLLAVPRFRRWGAWLTGFLLAAFMIYIGYHYNTLLGEECSCFPWLKRSVGPQFFIGDGIMLAMAAIAGWWTSPSH
ncbi:MAG: DoxX family protein, partial [Acidobacteriia bacterium]|nr:DoxX family protein [Terriglobia bacterium]